MNQHQQISPSGVQVVQIAPSFPPQYTSLKSRPVLALSIVNIVLFLAVLILGILFISVGQGFWAGLFLLVTGSIGIACNRTPTRPLRIALIVFSALSLFFTIVALILTGLGCIAACLLIPFIVIPDIVFYVIAVFINLALLILAAKAKPTSSPGTLPQTVQFQTVPQQYQMTSPTQVSYVSSGPVITSGQGR